MEGKDSVSRELARSNRLVVMSHTIEAFIISVAYFIEIIKGSRTVPYVLLIAAVSLIPAIIEIVMYRTSPAGKNIRYVMAIGVALMYTCIMLTASTPFVFVYVIPMIIVISGYNDFIFSSVFNLLAIVINIVEVIVMFMNGTFTSADSANIEIQIIVMIIICMYSVTATRILDMNNKDKVVEINANQQLVENNMKLALDVSSQMASKIEQVNDNVASLSESLTATKGAMEEVNSGSTDTADAVQKQLEQTEAITRKLTKITSDTDDIIGSVKQTKEAINNGNDNIDKLNEQISQCVKSGEDVTQKLNSLDVHMKQMNSIVDIITEITSQTSLLALNASIEAARAGEAGKGFAVVAGEINNMANQTQNATVDITKRIQEVLFAIEEVVNVTNLMIEEISNQKVLADHTKISFQMIENHSSNVSDKINELADEVTVLSSANQGIVDSVSTISAISEEVAAHANDTLRESDDNIVISESIVSLASELKELAGQLSQGQ